MRTFTLGAGTNVVKYSNAGETAKIASATAKDAIATAVTGVASSADTIKNVKVGDKITLATNSTNITKLVALSSGAVSSISGNLNATSNEGDVFVLKNGTDYFLVYEADGSGTAGSLGTNAEVIKLVGFTDNNTISVMDDNKTILIGG